jgi:ketosteroid isomerase-like protein
MTSAAGVEINRAELVQEVTEQFYRYEEALVTNDIATLDDMFWDSPLTVRYGDGQNLYGHAEISTFRQARPAGDLRRDLDRVVITTYGSDFATACAEFRRTGSGARGRQMQTWIRTPAGWRVVAAHVSLLSPG